MTTLAECVAETNKVFGHKFNKANVIALWPMELLRKFSVQDLDKLERLTREATIFEGRDSQRMMLRLLSRISEARGE